MEEKKKKSAIEWLAEFASEKKSLYIISVVVAIIGVVFSILPYIVMGQVIQDLLTGVKDWEVYGKECLIMGLCWILSNVCKSISTTCSHGATFQVLGSMRKHVLDHLAKVPLGYVLDHSTGSLKNVLVERIDSIETTLAHILPEFTSNILGSICLIIYLFIIDWRMALVSLITVPIGLLCYMGMMNGYEENFNNTVVKTKKLNDTAVEYINGIEVIKAFGKSESSYDKFVVAAKEGASCFIDWMRKCNVYFCVALVVMPATMITVLPIGGYFCMKGTLDSVEFIKIIILALGLIQPLLICMSYSDDLGKMGVIIGEVADILDTSDMARPEKSEATPKDTSIQLKDVKFGYHEKEILHGINMDIKAGTVNALVGPSGSGKSTIAKLIASLWNVTDGSILIGGVDIKKLSASDYYKTVAYVSQDSFLFDDTIRENIRIGRKDATDEEVEEVAKKSGCHDFILQLENGYDTVVGGTGGHVSGGEKQRIAIARAMLKDAPIVVLDEATAYTDPENEAIIQSSVAKLVQGKTLIVIAHRLSTIIDSDQIFVVKDGQIDSHGTHEELLAKKGLYSNMWEAHISVKDKAEQAQKGGMENA